MLKLHTLKKEMRAYAKANGLVILAFIRETYSNEVIGVAIKKTIILANTPLYCFGRLFHLSDTQCVFDQCGCYFTNDEREVRKEAYKYFGIK